MTLASGAPPGEPLRDLFARAIEQAKAYVQAEIAVAKRLALGWVDVAKMGIALGVAALFVLQAALTTLLVALGLALAALLGPAGGMAVAAVIGLVVAGLLGWAAARRFASGGG